MDKSGLEVFLAANAQTSEQTAAQSGEQLEFLNREKTASEIIYDTVSISNLSHGIRGLREVKQNIVDSITKAAFLSKQGYVPMILLIGPSGSGKTALVEGMRRLYYERIRTQQKLYTLEIDGKECPYKENGYNLMRSSLPFETKNAHFWSFRRGPEICASCSTSLEKLLAKGKDSEEFPISSVKFTRIFPQTATMQLNDEYMPDKFYDVVKNANRGLLLVSADKSTLASVSARTYQFLVNLYDNTLSDMHGNRVPLDMLVVLNSNEDFFEEKGKEAEGSRPLKERLLVVKVRRNLSYSEEENIYKSLNFPIKQMFPHALRYLALANVLSRIDTDSFKLSKSKSGPDKRTRSRPGLGMPIGLESDLDKEDTIDKVDTILSLLDMYETGSLINNKMTYSLLKALDEGDPYENIRNTILQNGEYKSGWQIGVSTRIVTNQLCTRDPNVFNFSDLDRYLSQNASNGLNVTKQSYMSRLLTADVMTKVDYAILSYRFRSYSADQEKLKKSIKVLEDYLDFLDREELNKTEKKIFEDPEMIIPMISSYINVEALKKSYKKYKERYAPLEAGFRTDFMQLLEFVYRHDNSQSLILREEKIDKEMYDKKSDTYKFVQELMEKQFSYWEGSFKEALSIYKHKNISTYDN